MSGAGPDSIRIDDLDLKSLSHCTWSYLLAVAFKRGSYSNGPSIPLQYERLDAGRWYVPLPRTARLGISCDGWQ